MKKRARRDYHIFSNSSGISLFDRTEQQQRLSSLRSPKWLTGTFGYYTSFSPKWIVQINELRTVTKEVIAIARQQLVMESTLGASDTDCDEKAVHAHFPWEDQKW